MRECRTKVQSVLYERRWGRNLNPTNYHDAAQCNVMKKTFVSGIVLNIFFIALH